MLTRSKKLKGWEMKKLSIAVTSLAPLINQDHYGNFSRIMSGLWKKVNESDYLKIEKICREKNLVISTDSFMKKIAVLEKKAGINKLISRQVYNINAIQNKSSKVLELQQNKIAKNIDGLQQLSNKEKQELKYLVNSATNTRFGISNESKGIDIFTQKTGKTIESSQGRQVLTFHTDDINGYIFEFVGKCDGITSDNKVVEIKNRQKKLFGEVRDYEMCQIQTYLHMIKLNKAYLVEVLPGNTASTTTHNIIEVDKDPDYFTQNVNPYIKKIVSFVTKLRSNEFTDDFKIKLMTGDDDKTCYQTYLNL